MENDSRIQSENPIGQRKQGIDVDFFDPRLFEDKPAKANKYSLERSDIHRRASPHAIQWCKKTRLLHQTPRQCGVKGWQSEGAIAVDFNELPTRAEQNHRTEL